MNKVIISGNLVRDPEKRVTTNNKIIASFTLAVDRRFKNASGEKETDFFDLTAWGNTAEFVCNYLKKGNKVMVSGSLQTRSFEKDGKKITVTEINTDEIEFAESKKEEKQPVLVETQEQLPWDLYKTTCKAEDYKNVTTNSKLPWEQ
jgi:single-strand DNA-binding protein